MRRTILATVVLVAAGVLVVSAGRAAALGRFTPAAAAEPTAIPTAPTSLAAPLRDTTIDEPSIEPPNLTVAAVATPGAPVASPAPSADLPAAAPAITATRPPTAAPVRTAAPTAQPVAPVAPVAQTPTPCNQGAWFCYPRLGISGAIVPYTDCSGSTDVGVQIRSFNCLSDHYLMAHAYTQFGKITAWRAGDLVVAYGQQFTVIGAFIQSSCTQPRLPLTPLELQTSLTPNACGDVLVVQAR